MKALTRSFTWAVFASMTVALALSVVSVQAQTPGQIPMFDPLGTSGVCNSAVGIECVDSVITQDASGNIGIGTNVNLNNSTATAGNILKGGVPFIHNAGPANTFIGQNAGNLAVTGDTNTGSGFGALSSNTSGFSNTAVGGLALFSNTSGDTNTAVGRGALQSNATGSQNTASGRSALISNITGSFNTADGVNALQSNSEGSLNTAIGESALFSNGSGNANTAVGDEALRNATGSSNIALGWQAGVNVRTGNDNIDIGNTGASDDSNTIRIGNCLGGIFGCAHRSFFAAGVATSGVSGGQVFVNGAGQLGVLPSSRRFKEDVRDMGDASSGLRRLRPVTFYYKQAPADGSRQLQYGLIAEEVAAVYPELVEYSDTGEPFSVRYHLLGAMLLNEVQQQHRQIQEQRQQIHAQAMQIAELKGQAAENADLRARLEALERLVKGTQTASAEPLQ